MSAIVRVKNLDFSKLNIDFKIFKNGVILLMKDFESGVYLTEIFHLVVLKLISFDILLKLSVCLTTRRTIKNTLQSKIENLLGNDREIKINRLEDTKNMRNVNLTLKIIYFIRNFFFI